MLNYTVGIECYRCGSTTDTRCEAPLNTMTGIIQNNWWPENKTADLSSTRYVVCLTLVQRSVGPGQEFLQLPADKDKGTKPNYGIAGSCTTLVTVFKTTGEVVYAQRFHTNPATVLHKLKKMPEKCDNVTEYDGEYNALQGRYVQPGDKPETITRVFCCKGQDYCNSQEFDLVWDRKTTAVSTSTPPKKSVTQAGSYLTSSSTIVVFLFSALWWCIVAFLL
ncbi:unnamed protein product [Didymodactylos carnosus]|uniref:Uncharacterized protein n=1 Tax=Didymodactylos carnosus TaxID=1234261 RepID=A0A8S2H6N6_9BILA|nr:unnamed protein product [Didymodactylos carnosus]CAF3606913.1 unnamed protein product [Didymodactylos carnosus]